MELCALLPAAFALTCLMTLPLVTKMGSTGRVDNHDGELSIWNVAWVARTIVVDPAHLYDANIFYPHRGTLAYSENNIGAGLLALPAYWWTRGNPYAAHNFAVLLAFTLSVTGMFLLVRHLTRDRRAAAVSAILFAYTPHVFAHTPHIQLLMTAGLPFTLLAFHRVVEQPTTRRGAHLGLAMAAQAVSCGYYGVFAILIVGYGVVVAGLFRRWSSRFWKALGAGALWAVAIVGPLFWPYLRLQQATGFARPLESAGRYSADWRAYFASAANLHLWLLPLLGHWNDVLFPGFIALSLAIAGVWLALRRRRHEVLVMYGGLAVLALWASFGPSAGLYTVLYRVLPLFAWLRAPSRFGLIVTLGLAVLGGFGLAGLLPSGRKGTVVGCLLAICAARELLLTYPTTDAPTLSKAYTVLRTLPPGPVIEMPFFYPEVGLFQHADYMLNSTSHWMPLVNGYSDYIPPDFLEHVRTLAPFPSRDAFGILRPLQVRYAMFHLTRYNSENRQDVLMRLKTFEDYLRPLYVDDQTRLYEIVGFPP